MSDRKSENRRPPGYQTLVFDWDGTLADSIATIIACTQRTMRQLDAPPVADETIRRAIGLGLRETVEAFCPGCDDELFRSIVEVYRHHWLAEYCHQVVLFPGAAETLRQLAASGYLLAVATAKGRRGLEQDLAATGLGNLFHTSRTVDEAPSKPHPGMLFEILDELGSPADQTLMIGDTTHDLEMAHNAGVAALGVSSGSHSREALEAAAAVACLDSVTELPAWLAADEG